MFVRKASSLPSDPEYPDDLEKLGYFINEEGFFKEIMNPDLNFNYHYTNDDRHNEMHREAMHKCTRRELYSHLAGLGVTRLYLPMLTTEPPDRSQATPHLPILATPADILKTRKRVVVLVNDSNQDLGILAYRLLHRSHGLFGGSVINMVREIKQRSLDAVALEALDRDSPPKSDSDSSRACVIDLVGDEAHPEVKKAVAKEVFAQEYLKKHPLPPIHAEETLSEETSKTFHVAEHANNLEHKDTPGVIIMNTGQQYFSYKSNEAMTIVSWHALPRASYMHPVVKLDGELNTVEGNRTPKEHIQFVFENVINNPKYVNRDAEIYVIGLESGAKDLLMLMNDDQDATLFPRQITALAMIQPGTTASDITNSELKSFLRHRARAWLKPEEDEPPNALVAKPGESASKIPRAVVGRAKKVDWLEVIASPNPQESEKEANRKRESFMGIENTKPTSSAQATPKGKERAVEPTDLPTLMSAVQQLAIEPNEETPLISKGKGEEPQPTLVPLEEFSTPFSSYDDPVCPTFSGGPGEPNRVDALECVFPRIYKHVLDFFEEVAQDPFRYQNPTFELPEQAGELAPFPPLLENENPVSESVVSVVPSSNWTNTSGRPKVIIGGEEVDEQLFKGAGLDDYEDDDAGGILLDLPVSVVAEAPRDVPMFAPEA